MADEAPPTTHIIVTKESPPLPLDQYVEPVRDANAQVTKDQATLIVGGINFRDWETVYVQLRWGDQAAYFRFTSVERDTPADMFYKLQFMPGTRCQINLGGVDVIDGVIEIRQVAADATQHGIELQGRSLTAKVAHSSVNTTTGSFDGMTFKQVADKVLSTYGSRIIPIGTLNSIPFDKLQNQPGESVWDFLERIARPRGIILGSDSFGNFLAIGDHSNPVVNTQLIEGQNIKKIQCVFEDTQTFNEYVVTAQSPASDDNAGTAASELRGSWAGTGWPGSLLITPSEQPVKQIQEVIDRAKNESVWHEGTKIEATVTVQGWFRDETTVWWPGDNVFVYSPMCPLNMMMTIQNVTFTQTPDGGTETELYLKQPWALLDESINVGPTPTSSNLPGPTPPGGGVQPTP
jgi:prophage tail gpP-like protein